MFFESQRLLPTLIYGVVLFLVGLMLWAVIQQLILGKPWGNNPTSDGWLVLIVVLVGLLLPAFLLSIRLRTEVTSQALRYQFWPLHIHWREIPVSDIQSAEALQFRPIRDSGGWGIRYGRHGWYYTVAGDRGVLIVRKSGRSLVIGSRRSMEMVVAIQAAMSGR